MKKKLFIIILIVLILMIAIIAIILDNLYNTYAAYRGEVPGTGFVYQELPGAGSTYYDVDNEGKIYFAIKNAILIYGNDGNYLYTLPINMGGGGAIFVKIDDEENIVVYDSKADGINVYDQKGRLIETIPEKNAEFYSDFSNKYHFNHVRQKPNGTIYENVDGTITKTENGVTIVVFAVPEWQKEASFFNVILVILILGTFLMVGLRFLRCFKLKKEPELLKKLK